MRLAGDEVDHRVHVDLRQRLAEAIGHRRQLVEDDHRLAVQRRLHGRRARRRDDRVGRVQHVVGLALGDAQRDAAEAERREQPVAEVRRARDHELHARDRAAMRGTAAAITGASRVELVVPAAGQQRQHRLRRIEIRAS